MRQVMCPACSAGEAELFLEIGSVPVHCNRLLPTREQAAAVSRGDLNLGFCRNCTHVFNTSFDPELMQYAPGYQNSLYFSGEFRRYLDELASLLVERYRLAGKRIIEIGCGTGEFLAVLCRLSGASGLGFDPSYSGTGADSSDVARTSFIRDFYDDRYAEHEADFICCRHTLEHISDPLRFTSMLRRVIGTRRDTVLFFEVPNASFTFQELGIWDLIYEHCSYFSRESLERLFATCGFTVIRLTESFGGQFLCLEARLNGHSEKRPAALAGSSSGRWDVETFAGKYRAKVEAWRRRLNRIRLAGRRAVVWGAGSKGTMFLNTLHMRHEVEYVVDVSPLKQGMYVAGTGQKIVGPEFLRTYRPDVVIVMNPIYENEIRLATSDLGLSPEFILA